MSKSDFPAMLLGILWAWLCGEIYDLRVRWSRRIILGVVIVAAVCAGVLR